MSLKERLEELRQQGLEEIKQSDDLDRVNDVRVKLLGKKGPLTSVLRGMKDLSADERPKVGKFANEIRDELKAALEEKRAQLEKAVLDAKLAAEAIDVTLPGTPVAQGQPHVLQQIIDQLEDLFIGMGYEVAVGDEVEQEVYNFEKLNLPKDHPARDMQDTFYVTDLKGTLEAVAQNLFGDQLKVRLRPSYFPFTEPSVEADITCFNCLGAGCSICKGTGWIEVLGAGMVHPNVLKMSGVDPEVYGGFAFGLGPDRFAMLKYGVEDIRDFYQNDVRFLTQFDQKG